MQTHNLRQSFPWTCLDIIFLMTVFLILKADFNDGLKTSFWSQVRCVDKLILYFEVLLSLKSFDKREFNM